MRCVKALRALFGNAELASADKKTAPLLGPDSKEAVRRVKSGKVMQGAVPRVGTGIRELSRTVEERDGHAAVCGLFVD